MANNNLETYLEAILDKVADGTETDIPRPSWNIEKYLAAIYEALSSGGGSGGGVLVVHDVDGTLDKTWKEIHDAFLTGAVRITIFNSIYNITSIYSVADENVFRIEYVVKGKNGAGIATYEATSASGYPSDPFA